MRHSSCVTAGFSMRERLALDACTACGQCVHVCPAVQASGDAELSAQVRVLTLKKLLQERHPLWKLWQKLLGKQEMGTPEKLRQYGTSVFRCTLCGDCQEVCPAGIALKDLWLSVREELVASGNASGNTLSKVHMIRQNIEKRHNVFDEDNDERADWVDDMRRPPDNGYQKKTADVIYFTGCVGAYFPLAQKIPMTFAEILAAGNVDFTLMGSDEWCCGFPLLGAGHGDALPQLINHNKAAVAARGAQSIVFTCPSCLQMWHEHYGHTGLRLMHASEMTLKLITEGALALGALPMKVTYHDPCDLGRGERIFDVPRKILSAIPGLELVEMAHNREHNLCCGGGGNLEMVDADLSKGIAKRKMDEILATGATAVITNCQQCVRSMTTFARRNKVPVEVMDMSQLVAKSLQARKK